MLKQICVLDLALGILKKTQIGGSRGTAEWIGGVTVAVIEGAFRTS